MSRSVPELINYVNYLRGKVTDLRANYKTLKCDYKLLAKENEALREDNRKLRDWLPSDARLITVLSQTRGNLHYHPDTWPPVKSPMRNIIATPLPKDPNLPQYPYDFHKDKDDKWAVICPHRFPNYNIEDFYKDK